MKKLFALISLLLLAVVAQVPAQAQDKLHLYNWNNYLAPQTAKRFEAFCKCELVQAYYGDNEEMLAKLAAGAKGYDIIVPTGNALQSLIKQKALRSEEHTSELQSLMSISYAVFCLKKKKQLQMTN